MSAQWATALIAAAGLVGNLCWTLVNLRIENRILTRIDEVKEWADERFVRRADTPVLYRKQSQA